MSLRLNSRGIFIAKTFKSLFYFISAEESIMIAISVFKSKSNLFTNITSYIVEIKMV